MKSRIVSASERSVSIIVVFIAALTLLACDLGSLTSFLPGQPTTPAITQATPLPGQPTVAQPPTASSQASPIAKPSAPVSSRDALFGKISDPS